MLVKLGRYIAGVLFLTSDVGPDKMLIACAAWALAALSALSILAAFVATNKFSGWGLLALGLAFLTWPALFGTNPRGNRDV